MKEAQDTAYKILSEHADQMHLMAEVLLERETVDGAACDALLDNTWDEYLAKEKAGLIGKDASGITVEVSADQAHGATEESASGRPCGFGGSGSPGSSGGAG